MGNRTRPRDKVAAVLHLAAGRSQAAAAGVAGVSASTVAQWRKDPVFVAEVEATRVVWERRPHDADALLARLKEAEAALTPGGGGTVVGGGPARVEVRVPAGASPREVERRTARAIGRGVAAVLRQEREQGE
ncbi:helix-turn-helix domain-containing protein [Streptomyces longwoodensis]|uniref:helix-turn-helix domain-containing protein n=1 Tax=Streptomyces longwoodensis TaxID=68231 RepID=UPI0033E4AFF7